MTGTFNLRAYRDQKRDVIVDHLSRFSQTFIASFPQGIHIYSPNVAKMHSTIALAGAGQDFSEIENWFRGQIKRLEADWGINVPRAQVEVRLIPPVFRPNLNASREIVHANLLVVEIAEEQCNDYIARVDCMGAITRLKPESFAVIGHKPEPGIDDGIRRGGAEGDDEHDQEDVEEVRATDMQTKKELQRMGIDEELLNLNSLSDAGSRLVVALDRLYPEKKVFLDREQLCARNFHQIFTSL